MYTRKPTIRLPGHDYGVDGMYYVTICTQGRAQFFGSIENDQMLLSEAGAMIERYWRSIPSRFLYTHIDTFVIMPDHLHGIIELSNGPNGRTHGSVPTIPHILQWFKTMTTNAYIRGVQNLGWTCFAGRLWQHSYFDRVVRNEKDLNRIREYIRLNPGNWNNDDNHQ